MPLRPEHVVFAIVLIFGAGSWQSVMGATLAPFPRVAVMMIGGSRNYEDPAVQKQLSRFGIALLNPWLGWEKLHKTTVNRVVRSIKSKNPNELIFLYDVINELQKPARPGITSEEAALDDNSWWLYTVGSSGTLAKSTWGDDFYLTNVTEFAPRDARGWRFTDWMANWEYREFVKPNPTIDGLYTDNVLYKPRVDGDWNRDGVTDSKDNPTVQHWFRQGNVDYFNALKALMPGKLQFGNVDWATPAAISYPEYIGQLNGGMMEGMIGFSWSIETWAGWKVMMDGYRKVMAGLGLPAIGMFAMIGGSSVDYQALRYGLTSCLMGDAYFVYNASSGYGDAPWFDEYDSNLGAALTGPPTKPWQRGVWRRDFTNGVALVNPKGNGSVVVSLGSSYRKLTGRQAPSVNSGALVTSVTLADRDGIILLRRDAPQERPEKLSGAL